MRSRPSTALAHQTVRAQYRLAGGRDIYAVTTIETDLGTPVVTVCSVDGLTCETRRITNESVAAFIRWHLDTVAALSRRSGA